VATANFRAGGLSGPSGAGDFGIRDGLKYGPGCWGPTYQVTNVPVEHEVRLMDFTKWLERDGGLPREMTDRQAHSIDSWDGEIG